MYLRWHHHRNLSNTGTRLELLGPFTTAGKYLGSKFLSEPSNIPPCPSPHPEPKWIETLVEDPKAAAQKTTKAANPDATAHLASLNHHLLSHPDFFNRNLHTQITSQGNAPEKSG